MKQTLAVLVTFFILQVNASAASSSFRYKTYLPAGADCNRELNSLAPRFETQTGAKITSKTCVSAGDGSDPDAPVAAVFIYERSTKVEPTVTTFGFNSDPSLDSVTGDSIGAYQMKLDCDADLQNQVSLFKKVNGVEPFTSYCDHDQLSSNFVLKIEAFSALKNQLYVFMTSNNIPNETDLSAITSRVLKSGVPVARATQNTIYFYDHKSNDSASARLKLKSEYAATFADDSECQSQRLALTQILPADTVLFCTDGLASVLQTVSAPLNLSYETSSAASYESLNECLSDIKRVLDQERSRSSRIAGGICSYTGADQRNPYTVQLVKRN